MSLKRVLAMVVLFALFVTAAVPPADGAEGTGSLLVDRGNGDTEWIEMDGGDTLLDALTHAAESHGISLEYKSGVMIIDGISGMTIGAPGSGSYTQPGTTGVKVSVSWNLYGWDSGWVQIPLSVLNSEYDGGSYAVGYYPDGTVPVQTPDHRQAWTMVRGDALQSSSEDNFPDIDAGTAEVAWTKEGYSGVYSTALYANGHVYVKYGTGTGMKAGDTASLRCYSLDGTEQWAFLFPGNGIYENSTPLIVGDSIYVASGSGYMFKLPLTGPGEDNRFVMAMDGRTYNDVVRYDGNSYTLKERIPYAIDGKIYTGQVFSTGPASPVLSNGCIYTLCSNGMVYCFDLDLNLVWSSERATRSYFMSPTVIDGFLFCGDLGGDLYAIDAYDGEIIDSTHVFSREYKKQQYGGVNAVSVLESDRGYELFFGFTDGRGLNCLAGGIAHYMFDGTSLTKVTVDDSVGVVSNYIVAVDNELFSGAYFMCTSGMGRISVDGTVEIINDSIAEVHAAPLLVNGDTFYLASYTKGKDLYTVGLDGRVTSQIAMPLDNYNMSPVVLIGSYTFVGNDDGFAVIYGDYPVEAPPVGPTGNWYDVWLIALGALAAAIIAVYLIRRFVLHMERPFRDMGKRFVASVDGKGTSHNTRNRRRLRLVLLVGGICVALMFVVSLMFGSSASLSIGETFSALFSAIGKGGQGLVGNEVVVYSSRLPRTLAALAVGVGLSIAGAVYQAIIRNPLVDPYIMGVSSGAGTAAVAVIAFEFTFFGLFPSHSIYLTAIAAMVGGILAFGCTMLIAEKAGGSSLNYVLAGVVIGLAFSAVQTLLISFAGHKVTNALSWLFGSFSNVSWTQVWMIVIPAIVLSVIPLVWAKEFNLVLLGDDQAKQMGLDVVRFDRWMLILASVLTSVCVAFVGIIGFVGLVVPHLCRMVLGGDHRLVMPASMVVGAALMMLADFASRMVIPGLELPVGAITTVIGVPVFAYLLIKKGRMYDG